MSTESKPSVDQPMASPQRPVDRTIRDTTDLPQGPSRDRTIPASAWRQAPPELLELSSRFGGPNGPGDHGPAGTEAAFLRRIGPWLLWRAGPPRGGEACLWAARSQDLTDRYSFRLFPDGTGDGVGPSGRRHQRFRTWKEDLRDAD